MSDRGDSPIRRLGAYEVERALGCGGMGTVFAARHTTLGLRAAIKVLHPHLARDPVATARFLREGRALARVRHPNVVDVLDSGVQAGVPYLIMELLEGDDLLAHLQRGQPPPIHEVVDCLLPVVAAVAAAHAAGIVHRDLKPSNIRLAHDERGSALPKVLDFGISKWTLEAPDPPLTDSGSGLGTIGYMAPEQLRSAKNADPRSDVYSLGAILYECTTGRKPFRGDSVYELMHAVVTKPLPAPSTLRPDLGPAFDAVVMRAMSRGAAERFPSARSLGLALASMSSDPQRWTTEFAGAANGCDMRSPGVDDAPRCGQTLGSTSRPRRGRLPIRLMLAATAVFAAAFTLGAARPPRASPTTGPSSAAAPTKPRPSFAASAAAGPARVVQLGPSVPSPEEPTPTRKELVRVPRRRPWPPPQEPVVAASHDDPSAAQVGTNGAPIVE